MLSVINQFRPAKIYLLAIVSLVAITAFDCVTPYEIFTLYFLPISIVAVQFGRKRGLLMALLASVSWAVAAWIVPPFMGSTSVLIWYATMRVMSFAIVAISMARMGSELRQLREIVPICADCKKVRDDQGYWNQVENYLRKYIKTPVTHGLCPDCSAKLRALNVLLVDNDVGEFLSVKCALAKADLPHVLHCADTMERAVNWMLGRGLHADRDRFPSPDVLLINASAVKEAFRLLAWVRGHGDFQRLPVLVIGATGDDEQRKRALEWRANSFVFETEDYKSVAEFLRAAHR